jgi:hypothetical protein
MAKRSINAVRKECFDAFARGDTAEGMRLQHEYRAMIAAGRKRDKPMRPETKARRRAFARLAGY